MSDDPALRQAQELTEPGETSSDPVSATLDDVGDLHVGTVVVNTQDMARAVRFWTRALGYRSREGEFDPEFMKLDDPAGARLSLSLQITDQPSATPVRLHLDLYTAEPERQIERLVGLGAVRAPDWVYPDAPEEDADFVVLRDPDGNEFCVVDHRPG